MNSQLVTCSCNSDEHNLIFKIDKEYVFVSIFLGTGNFFERLWKGTRYIFGYKGRYGDFSETILDVKGATDIKELLEIYLEKQSKIKTYNKNKSMFSQNLEYIFCEVAKEPWREAKYNLLNLLLNKMFKQNMMTFVTSEVILKNELFIMKFNISCGSDRQKLKPLVTRMLEEDFYMDFEVT